MRSALRLALCSFCGSLGVRDLCRKHQTLDVLGSRQSSETMGADLSHSRSVQAAVRGVRAYSTGKSAPPSFGVEKNRDVHHVRATPL